MHLGRRENIISEGERGGGDMVFGPIYIHICTVGPC